MALRIAALVKQVPVGERLELGIDGRLVRDGIAMELNPYCRRAVSKGVELADTAGGTCTIFCLGPPEADDVLREALAWGAHDAIHICDPAFAGSDTLATSRALAAAISAFGPFDLILAGRNSVDADTGQVGPQLAEHLGVPFACGVRELTIDGSRIRARCELDDGWMDVATTLPAVLSVAERLCDPAKVDQAGRSAVDAARIRTVSAIELGSGPWGATASPTSVGEIVRIDSRRTNHRLGGPIAVQVESAVDLLVDRGALRPPASDGSALRVLAASAGDATSVAVLVEPGRPGLRQDLLGAAHDLASGLGGHVAAIVTAEAPGVPSALCAEGADRVVCIGGSQVEEDIAAAAADWLDRARPEIVLAPATAWGREVAARVAVRLGAGLTGDAVDLDLGDGRLVAWKPAFGGSLLAAITASSDIQMATVRPGVLSGRRGERRPNAMPIVEDIVARRRGRLEVTRRGRDDDVEQLAGAAAVIGVGGAVSPERYHELEALRVLLDAELAATRKVTDKGWMPRARQVGITGRSISPQLYLALGIQGKFNHMVGVRQAATLLAVNNDPDAPIFGQSDVGIVGDWGEVVPLMVAAISARLDLPERQTQPIAD